MKRIPIPVLLFAFVTLFHTVDAKIPSGVHDPSEEGFRSILPINRIRASIPENIATRQKVLYHRCYTKCYT